MRLIFNATNHHVRFQPRLQGAGARAMGTRVGAGVQRKGGGWTGGGEGGAISTFHTSGAAGIGFTTVI